MTKKTFAICFGLAALALSLFASTAFAVNTSGPGTTQVVVTNSPAQPVPMVGLVKDGDNPARKPFRWSGSIASGGGNVTLNVMTVPANQRFVLEEVSALCSGATSHLSVNSYTQGVTPLIIQYLPSSFWTQGSGTTPVRFYVDPNDNLNLFTQSNNAYGSCGVTLIGYFIDLP